MHSFYINLAIGICLTALVFAVFFLAAGKSQKKRLADRELVFTLGDEGLIRLYEQAETDYERDGIVEFVKEKLSSAEPASSDLIPAGSLSAPEQAPPEAMVKAEETIPPLTKPAAEEQLPQISPDMGEILTPALEPMPEPSIAEATQPAVEAVAEPIPEQIAPETAEQMTEPKQYPWANNRRRQISGMLTVEEEEAAEDDTEIVAQTQTHELPLEEMDWATIEEALERKREESARIMAHNQLIQNVFSKIQGVENRVVGENKEQEE
jgi:hypothetical protein